jgi:ferrous iron transport protein A
MLHSSVFSALTLDRVPLGARHVVAAVAAPSTAPEWARWLEEIGFIPGEQVVLMARAALGGDPLVVRIGQSTFALRRAEAACIQLKAAA